MSKYVVFGLCILSLLFSSVDAQDANPSCAPAEGQPLSIGAVFPPDGLFTAEAGDPYHGVEMMVKAINACGGVDGRPIELVYIAASNREQASEAVEQLSGQVPLVIGSGSLAVSEVLYEASADGAFLYWEVSEPLDERHVWAYSPLVSNYHFGEIAAGFINLQIPTLLNGDELRVALLHENRPKAQRVAEGLVSGLSVSPIIEHDYDTNLTDSYDLAVDMREAGINVVVVTAFEDDTDQLWYDMREADANVQAWVQVGGERYRRDSCQRLGNTDGMISISTVGAINEDYRLETVGAVYEQYVALYEQVYGHAPNEQADLTASGVYLLLTHILSRVEGDFTAENIRAAILATDIPLSLGLMGEGLSISAETGENGSAVAIAQQRQYNQYCTISPSAVANCAETLQPFPDWRTRVSQPEYATC